MTDVNDWLQYGRPGAATSTETLELRARVAELENEIEELRKDLVLREITDKDILVYKIAELERVLRMVEWVEQQQEEYPLWCAWCNYIEPDHAPDCPRQKVLGE